LAFTERTSPPLADLEEAELEAAAPAGPRIERTTPTLEDAYPLALAARERGEWFVDLEMSGLGREWAPRVACFGLWGRVVARRREAPRNASQPIDSGAITRILVRFEVIAVLDMYRRVRVKQLTPQPVLAINKLRRRPRNVTIR
jgi:hypothetical protein